MLEQDAYDNPWYGCYDIEHHNAFALIHKPEALAYEWIQAYAETLSAGCDENEGDSPIYPSELIETALGNIGESNHYNDFITRGSILEGEHVDSLFWVKLALFTGKEIDEKDRNSFFSCSC